MNVLEPEREWIHSNEYLTKLIVGIVIILALGAAFAWQRMKYERLQGQYHALALKAVNDSAALDTTRKLALSRADSVKILGDSLAAVTHLSVQETTKADALDHALAQVRTATEKLTAQVHALEIRTTSTGDVATSAAGARSATFAVDSEPYHGTAAVTLPAVGKGSLDLRIHLSSAPLDVVLGCNAANSAGIRAAAVTVLGPKWLDVGVTSSQQSPEICNAEKAPPRRWFAAPDLVYGFGRVFGPHGSEWGAFVGVGGRVGP